LNKIFSRDEEDIVVVFYYSISKNVFEESHEDTVFLAAPGDKNQHFHNQVEILHKKKDMVVYVYLEEEKIPNDMKTKYTQNQLCILTNTGCELQLTKARNIS
jgi:hypothetical protein